MSNELEENKSEYCQVHLEYTCEGPHTTRRSIFGAEVKACYEAWSRINLEKWPELIQ